MVLFIDLDILLDAVLTREPFDFYAVRVLSLVDSGNHVLYTSAHSLINVYYFTKKIAGQPAALKSISLLREKLEIAPTNNKAIGYALASDFTDIEDAVQYDIALQNKCKVIITRNIKDYQKSSIPVMTAEQYLRSTFG